METKEYSDLLKKNIWTDQECKQVADYLVKKAGILKEELRDT